MNDHAHNYERYTQLDYLGYILEVCVVCGHRRWFHMEPNGDMYYRDKPPCDEKKEDQ